MVNLGLGFKGNLEEGVSTGRCIFLHSKGIENGVVNVGTDDDKFPIKILIELFPQRFLAKKYILRCEDFHNFMIRGPCGR